MNRQLLVSFHHPGTTHDQVIYGRFGNGDISSINKLIQKSIGNTHNPKKQTYKGEEIIIYPIGKDFLACYIQPGFFAASFQKKLIEQVIDTYQNENSVSQNESFISLGKQRKHNEQLSLYLHPEGNNQAWQHYEIRMSRIILRASSVRPCSIASRYAGISCSIGHPPLHGAWKQLSIGRSFEVF